LGEFRDVAPLRHLWPYVGLYLDPDFPDHVTENWEEIPPPANGFSIEPWGLIQHPVTPASQAIFDHLHLFALTLVDTRRAACDCANGSALTSVMSITHASDRSTHDSTRTRAPGCLFSHGNLLGVSLALGQVTVVIDHVALPLVDDDLVGGCTSGDRKHYRHYQEEILFHENDLLFCATAVGCPFILAKKCEANMKTETAGITLQRLLPGARSYFPSFWSFSRFPFGMR
jgi:hypothetical protein